MSTPNHRNPNGRGAYGKNDSRSHLDSNHDLVTPLAKSGHKRHPTPIKSPCYLTYVMQSCSTATRGKSKGIGGLLDEHFPALLTLNLFARNFAKRKCCRSYQQTTRKTSQTCGARSPADHQSPRRCVIVRVCRPVPVAERLGVLLQSRR